MNLYPYGMLVQQVEDQLAMPLHWPLFSDFIPGRGGKEAGCACMCVCLCLSNVCVSSVT